MLYLSIAPLTFCYQIDIFNSENPQNGVGKLGLKLLLNWLAFPINAGMFLYSILDVGRLWQFSFFLLVAQSGKLAYKTACPNMPE